MTRPGAPIVSVQGLSKRYGERLALSDVSLELRPGELVAVIGANGAGKTTLLSIIAGVQSASSGSVTGSGAGRAIGWAPQQPAVYSKLSVVENLRLFARLEGVAEPQAAVERMLEQTDLRDRADERVETLSGGNRQRVNVALGLIAAPQALALDEPTSALDPPQRERLWQFLASLAARGTAVLFSTHHLSEVRRYATRAIVLADGEMLFDDTPARLIAAGGAGGEDFEAAFAALLRKHGRQ